MTTTTEIERRLQDALTRQKIRCEEECIKGVLRNLLDREPTMDDAKACGQILSDPWDGSYQLLYNGIKIGVVRYVEENSKFRVEFTPVQKQN
jgi:hypothetical protein